MATAISANKAELLAIADAVAREKLIDRDIVIEAMEDAIQRAARSRYGAENDIRAKIDPKSGDMRLWRGLGVVDLADDYFNPISPKDAPNKQAGAAICDSRQESRPPVGFGPMSTPDAQQGSFQKGRQDKHTSERHTPMSTTY